MNIALSAVIISILLIPPIIFYLSFYLGKYPRAIPKFTLFEGILGAAVFSLFVHALATHYFISSEIRYDILIKLLGGELKDLEKKVPDNEFQAALSDFALYNLCLNAAMVVLGRCFRQILLWTGWHAKYPVLNLYNKWWYLFNGFYNGIKDPDLIFIDLVVDTNESTVIYSGYLANFDFTNGELERVYLQDTLKREFIGTGKTGQDANEVNTTEPYAIPGDIFSIAYKNILNINIHFISFDNSLEEIEQLPDATTEDTPGTGA
ncbi:MAG: hypothetical protein JWP78_1352 [Mucilaginibacter sp.]|nr:hypothetical protein [Mucilaginibacter sp.]